MRFISLFLFSIFSLLFNRDLTCQNLVFDPGFEMTTDDCIGIPPLQTWFNPNLATPDVWTSLECGNTLTEEVMLNLGVPLPYEGNNYLGLLCCMPPESNDQTRDYLTTQFIQDLESDQIYSVSFMLSRRVNRDIAIDRLGIYFSSDAPYFDNSVIMDVEPQLETFGEILTPDLIWIPIQFTYTAIGYERYMTIGNFRDIDDMLWVDVDADPNYHNSAYYLFDDIKVEPLTDELAELQETDQCEFNSKQAMISSDSQLDYFIYSVEGKLIISGFSPGGSHFIELSELSFGTYILHARSYKKQWNFKFIAE